MNNLEKRNIHRKLSQLVEVQFPIQLRQMSKDETIEYYLKRLQKLSEESIGQILQLEEPTGEQQEWVLFRLSQPETWPHLKENKIGDEKNWS